MSALIERLRAARESTVEIDGITLKVRRPTHTDLVYLRSDTDEQFVRRCVVGWVGVREVDVVPGGAAHLVDFDIDVCVEWFKDVPGRWGKLGEAISTIIRAYFDSLESAEKK
jgi:hypothetical protein